MKQKTNRAANKRFKITGSGKIKKQRVNQSHFNAKDTGHDTRRKHKGSIVDKTDMKRVNQLLPNRR